MNRPPVQVDLRPYFKGEEKGHAAKSMIVLHETISYNRIGTGDIKGVSAFVDAAGYEIHGIVDLDRNSAWCYDPTAVYDHAASGQGMVNTKAIGFELISEIPLLPSPLRFKTWWARRRQLDRVAEWCAWLSETQEIPLVYSQSDGPGITTHWNVSRRWLGGHGHWDCWPRNEGGHFPLMYVIYKARKLKGGL